MTEWDAVVIGSGAGGAPVAALLAEAGWAVALVEAGGPAEVVPPAEALRRYYLQQGTLTSWGNAPVGILAGEAVGGSTVVHAGTCLDPPDAVLEEWGAALGADLRGEIAEILPAVRRDLGVDTPPRDLVGRSNLLALAGAAALGAHGEILPRGARGCRGAGRCTFVCPHGAKLSADRTYIPRARAAGAQVLARHRAGRITPGRGGVVIETRGPEGRRLLRARELVLAAGALGTPGLIRRNRLGPGWRQAGGGLTLHPAAKVVAAFPERVEGWRGVPQGAAIPLPGWPGILLEGAFLPRELIEAALMAGGSDLRWWLERYDHLAAFGLMARDTGRGSVRWLGRLPLVRYDLHPRDCAGLVAGMIFLARAFFRAGAYRVLLPITGAMNQFSSEAELERLRPDRVRPSQLDLAGFHPLGTAGLGRAASPEGQVAPHVWVADGSALPGPPGVNPQVTITAFAHRAARRLLAG